MTIDHTVFLDSSYAIALVTPKDRHHVIANDLADILEVNRVHLVTSRPVLMEIGNALSRSNHRQAAIFLLDELHSDHTVEIIEFTSDLYNASYQLYVSRPDKEWGLTDCCSFEIMRRHNIHQALTADQHFVQAGFQALLLM